MLLSFKYGLGIVLGVAVLVLLFDGVRMYMLARKSQTLIESITPFERTLVNPSKTILVLGDSTAYGTGARTKEETTAGYVGSLFENASIKNLSQNGQRLSGLASLVTSFESDLQYDSILVQIGANDIIRLTSRNSIERDAEIVFSKLSSHTNNLIVLHSGNVGDARFFPRYLAPILSKRSFAMRDLYTNLAKDYGAEYVDLIASPADELLRFNPEKYYANDKLHLSSEGYELWFNEIKKHIK